MLNIKRFLVAMVTNGSSVSSGRVINVIGAIVAALLLGLDTVLNGKLDSVNFGAFLGYCAGNFIGSKTLDTIANNTNPAQLQPVTLTCDTVKLIKADIAAGIPNFDISVKYNVDINIITDIANGTQYSECV